MAMEQEEREEKEESTLKERVRSLKNLSEAVGAGLEKEIERNKASRRNSLIQDFSREITLANACVYNGDFDGALYHGLMSDMIHKALKDLEQERR